MDNAERKQLYDSIYAHCAALSATGVTDEALTDALITIGTNVSVRLVGPTTTATLLREMAKQIERNPRRRP